MRAVFLILLTITAVWCQVAQEANKDYATAKDRANLVARLENPARLARIKPAELVAKFEIRPGSTVVDLGAGTGTLLTALSNAVGPKGHVVAEDIHADFLERARATVKAGGLTNVEFLVGTETDPKLKANSADLVIILDAYHHFDYPEKMLAAIKTGLKPGGRLAIIEYHKKRGAMEVADDPDFAVKHVRAGDEQVTREVEAAGYKRLWQREHAPGSQYIAMFQKP